jgi:hypothetical protein
LSASRQFVLLKNLQIKTNPSILISINGKDVELIAADLIKMRENERSKKYH